MSLWMIIEFFPHLSDPRFIYERDQTHERKIGETKRWIVYPLLKQVNSNLDVVVGITYAGNTCANPDTSLCEFKCTSSGANRNERNESSQVKSAK